MAFPFDRVQTGGFSVHISAGWGYRKAPNHTSHHAFVMVPAITVP